MSETRRYLWITLGVLASVTALKVVLGALAGLGDSEALYAVYSLHPQGGYLDHPPAIGWVIRATTALAGTSPLAVRLGSIIFFTGTALLLFDLARRLGGSARAGMIAVLLLCAVPITFVGGLAATPDAPAALFWVLACWLAVRNVQDGLADRRPLVTGVIMGLVLGLGFLSKYTHVLLLVSYLGFIMARRRGWILTHALPMVVVALAVASPVIIWNQTHDWASVMHRFVWTQDQAGPSARNLGALLGGQLLYVSPVVMVLVILAMIHLWRTRSEPRQLLMAVLTWGPAIALWLLCTMSRVAEPHWPVPAYLPVLALLGVQWERSSPFPGRRKWIAAGLGVAVLFTTLGLLVAATPLATRWSVVDPETDITNELRGWDQVREAVLDVTPDRAIVVGPHWTVCAQLEWQLQDRRDVACVTVEQDDWDQWNPIRTRDPEVYPHLYYVTYERFEHLDPFILTTEARLLTTVAVERAGRVVRTFRIYRR